MGYKNYGLDPYYDPWRQHEHRRDHRHHRPYDGYGRGGFSPCGTCPPLPPIGPRPYPRGRVPYRDYPRFF